MTYYHDQIRKIKNKGSVDFIKIFDAGNVITLRLVDESDETVYLLTEWRKKYRNMFGTNFKMSKEKTKQWIKKDNLDNPDQILFMIYLEDKKIGNIGTNLYDEKTNSAELYNIMKDPNLNYPGLITTIEKVYLKWMFDGLKLSKICGRLFSDNYKMMNVHLRCGWVIAGVIPLKRKFNENGWIWDKMELKSEDEWAERYNNAIELTRESLMKNFGDIKYEILIK